MHLLFILCLFTLPLAMSLPPSTNETFQVNNIAKPHCPTHCGNISIPYPFGIGNDTGCSLDHSFYVTCNSSYTPPKLFLRSGNIEIYNITDAEIRIRTGVAYKCYDEDGSVSDDYDWWTNLKEFTLSTKNKLTVLGCDDYALIRGTASGTDFSGGCFGLCSKEESVTSGLCSGMGCGQTSIPMGLNYYNLTLGSLENHTEVWSYSPCGYAFLGEEDSFQFHGVSDLKNTSEFWHRIRSTIPVVVDWVIEPGHICSENNMCKGNSSCHDVDGGGYLCRCNNGYEGNPYLDSGCRDINECDDPNNNSCYGVCVNTLGSHSCTCPDGHIGVATIKNGCVPADNKSKFLMVLVLALVFGLLGISLVGIMIYCGQKKRKLTKLQEKFFEQNGGVFLKQKLKAVGTSEMGSLFTSEQLQKATDNYSEERIIGHGGYGVVYKGILTDERVVAIKKSKLVDKTQAEQFINEVMILTQVIHRNVVKLLGCCLEEEVPVLVYEFVSNNTLFYHIHNTPGGMRWLSWENRLRVAAEAAGALGYLHSQATMPILHRDVKSSNILIDGNYTAKISDFGASRLVPLDHDHVTTLVQGTLGYLDPQYFNTSLLTDKSDVYSFGVVLAELITGKKPLCADRTNEEKNLATLFVKSMKENRLYQIVDPRVLCEGTLDQLQAVAGLVKRCLNLEGEDRPTMKEVEMELEGLRKFTTHPWVQMQTPEESRSLILEIEQSDLYAVPLVPYSSNEWESYSGNVVVGCQENKPR